MAIVAVTATSICGEETEQAAPPAARPSLYLVGDSTMKAGTGRGERGVWGWASLAPRFFDPKRIDVHNEAHGGRSSRSYIEEGLWAKVVERLQPGDFVIVQFGHNDRRNSDAHPNRISIAGSGDETEETQSPVTGEHETIHTYGWYLRHYAKDAKAKGAVPIICSPIPRNAWREGKIERGFNGYAQWAADAAKSGGTHFIDLNTIAADRCDSLGQATVKGYFADFQHTNEQGALMMAASVAQGIQQLDECSLRDYLVTPPSAR